MSLTLLEDDYQPADQEVMSGYLRNYDTPMGRYLGAKVGQGWFDSMLGQGVTEAGLSPSGDPRIGARSKAIRETPYLNQDDWKAGPHFREGLKFENYMSDARARDRAEVFDDNTYRNWLISQRQNGVTGAVLGFGAAMLGGAPDPVNYIPFGAAERIALAAKGTGILGKRIVPAFLGHAAEAGAGTALTEPALIASLGQWGDDFTWGDIVTDIALGAATGGVIGGGIEAFRGLRYPLGTLPGGPAPEEQHANGADALNLSVSDLAGNREPEPPPIDFSEVGDGGDTSLFGMIRKLGGIKTKDAAGNVTKEGQEVDAILKDAPRSLRNDTTGITPDYMRERLQLDGWFGQTGGRDIQDFYNALKQESQGAPVYHPESGRPSRESAARIEEQNNVARETVMDTARQYGATLTEEDISAIFARGRRGDLETATIDYLERQAIEAPDLTISVTKNDVPASQYGPAFDRVDIMKGGKKAAEALVRYDPETKTLIVEDIYTEGQRPGQRFKKGELGTAATRSVLRLLRQEYPEAEFIGGERISGARGVLDRFAGQDGTQVKMRLQPYRGQAAATPRAAVDLFAPKIGAEALGDVAEPAKPAKTNAEGVTTPPEPVLSDAEEEVAALMRNMRDEAAKYRAEYDAAVRDSLAAEEGIDAGYERAMICLRNGELE